MSKKIYIGENDLIKIKRFMTGRKTGHKPFIAENEPPYEKDEFEIGGEGGNNDYFHINENTNKKPKNIITESQESKSIAAAKKLVSQRLGYNEQEADEFVRIKLRNDIPSLRAPQGGKFILGVTRMFCDGELRNANDIGNLNSTLKLVASDAHINEYDRNLNGLSAQGLIQRFAKAMSDNLEAEKSEIAQMTFDSPSDYEIVRIDSFEQAEEYGHYVSWCVTHDENMFNSYTSDGINQFYFCLKNGFENIEETPSEGCPLDEYGLSMIAVSVNENGMLSTCTCRWNHGNGGNDSIMNAKQVSQLIGMNFFEVFKPNNKWKDLLTSAMQHLANGEDPRNVFNYVGNFREGFATIRLNNKWNYINQEGKILSDLWYDYCDIFKNGFARVQIGNKHTFIREDGKRLNNEWYDYCFTFENGFARVKISDKYTFIREDGQHINDEWYDYCDNFKNGFACVKLGEKWTFIREDGQHINDEWYDWCNDFKNGFARVGIGGKLYKINTSGRRYNFESVDRNNNKLIINEYNADLRLPFEEPEYANKFYIEQYKDWLEDYGKYGSLPSGTLEFWDEIKQAVVEIKAKQLHGRFDGSIPEDKNADEIFYDLQTRLIGPYIKFTNDGKVYVERAISINKRPRGYDNSQRTDFYKQLWKDYNDNVGGCWSYCKDGAQAYCGDDYGYSIILRGYIRTDDIDFIKTVQLNYHYPGEHEIRVKPFAKVELFNFSYGNDTINFNKRLIVSSTYSGNNSKFIGNVGKIDDGFGGITYINRQNKVLNGEEEYNNELNKYVDDCLAKGYELSDIFDYCGDFKNGFASVKLDEKWTFIREDGKRINNEWYDFCSNFANGFARVRLGKKWTFISEDGKRLNNEWYDFCGSFINSFARVNLGEKWTFIREDGAYLNNEWYDYCDSFKNGFAVVLMGNKETFIREDGKRLNNEWYDYCNNFKNGFAKVKIDNKWYNIDTSGRRFTAESVNKNSKKLIMNENQLIALKENIETEVESNEVNLSSFKKNDSLAKRIWDGMDLNPRVRLKLLDIADDFWDFTDINWVKPKGIHLTGSICNFNWSDESDIDLHLVVDFSEVDDRKDFVQEYFNSKKNEWNEEHSNLKIFGYPVELYVEDVNAETVSSGIYDLEENKWISEPSKDEIEEIGLDKYEIKSLAAKLMTKIDDLYDEFSATDDDAKLRSIGERADKLLSSIKQMRKDGLSRGGESDPFNVVYKVLRRADYLENLFNLKSELYDKLNSIDIEESVIKYYYNKICPLNEEIVADGSAEHNPFKKRWKYEREALKSYLCNNGEIMTSKENGKQYKVIFDTMLSQRLGLNYCICIQWNPITMEPGNIIYVRAYDKFTKKIFTPQFDARGYDNVQGTSDDLNVY